MANSGYSATRLRAAAPWLAAIAGLACDPQPRRAGAETTCASARGDHVTLLGRAHDVLVTPWGSYVVGASSGVIELDGCTLARRGGCEDHAEARRLVLRAGTRVVDYLRDTPAGPAACDLARSVPVPPGSIPATHEARVRDGDVEAWVEGGQAWLRPGALPPRPLRTPDPALAIAIDGRHRVVAVGDRGGGVSVYSVPGALRFERTIAHGRNVYALAFDVPNARIVSVSGPGLLDVRPLTPTVLAWTRSLASTP